MSSPAFHLPLSADRYCPVLPLERGTFHAVIITYVHGVTIRTKVDYLLAFRTSCRFEFGRIFQFLKVVFIRPIIDIHFSLEAIPAFLAGLPIARMPFVEMRTAQGVAIMVSVTTIASVGKQDITVCVVANPVVAALGFGQVFGFSAQPTTRLIAVF